MALVLSILRKAHATGTHHQLALDALSELPVDNPAAWERVFYRYINLYVDGAKAPDKAFKDFENHVLHPRHGYWGGATTQAATWYVETVDALKKQDFGAAAYAAGVLSHYVTDPLQPLHTHQTEAENAIHAAAEWSVSKTYSNLRQLGLTLNVSKPVDPAASIEALLREGADRATAHYETILAHYDIKRGVVAPEEGLDPVGRRAMAEMLVRASHLFALILGRAIAEAGVAPPEVALASDALRAFMRLPGASRRRRALDAADRRQIEAMYDELMATGHVEKTLPEDERKIRDLFAIEVLAKVTQTPAAQVETPSAQTPLAPSQHRAETAPSPATEEELDPEDPAGAVSMSRKRVAVDAPRPAPKPIEAPAIRNRAEANSQDESSTDAAVATPPPTPAPTMAAFADMKPVQINPPQSAAPAPALASYRPSTSRGARAPLSLEADVVDAPSVGAKTAAKLNAVGIDTVGDFLKAHPIALAARLEDDRMTPVILTEWQDQTRLMCTLGDLRAGDAKLLVGAGYRTVEAITNVEADQLSADILTFALSKDGQALLRDGNVPDVEKIRGWASEARAVKAA
jgi:hypothetical protein